MSDYREYRPKDMAAAILKVPNHSTIVDAEAQIDDTHGVAAVTVSATGTADNRTLHFRFTGLRGRDGDTAADEYDGVSNFPTNGITGVIYIDTSTNVSYRWAGSGYVPIAMPPSMRGAANGLASLDQNGKVPSGQLPSYVDDVLEYANAASFPSGGESGKIYVALDTNLAYRWSGSSYVEISKSLALGETGSTAYRGDRGREAYDHAQLRGSGFASGLYKIGTNSEGHVTSAESVSKGDITALGIPAQDTTYQDATSVSHGLMGASDKEKLDTVERGATSNSASDAEPSADGNASAGTSPRYSRADHVHPTDPTRAPLESPALSGTPTAPTAGPGTSTDQIATTSFVARELGEGLSSLEGQLSSFEELLSSLEERLSSLEGRLAALEGGE